MSQSANAKKPSPVIQEARRRALIDATTTAIAQYGFSGLTLQRIAGLAGLTAGTVNFYFTNKESLLLETLRAVVEEFDQTVAAAMATAGDDPADRLRVLVLSSFAPELLEPRKVAVWYAFMAEARARADYQRICGQRDDSYTQQLVDHIAALIATCPEPRPMDANAIAHALSGLIDEMWQSILFDAPEFNLEDARHNCLAFLASMFQWAYTMPEAPVARRVEEGEKPNGGWRLLRAQRSHLAELARLFDSYRQFYQQAGDHELAAAFLTARFDADDSVIFLAMDDSGRGLGFVQLYPAICSVAAAPFFVLYDLYVDDQARGTGLGRALMARAQAHATAAGALRIDLETAVDNHRAQALYESLGYQRETAFYKYSLELPAA